jgi:hypothetical protein
MARPVVHDVTERVYGRLPDAYRVEDAKRDWPLLRYVSLLVDRVGATEDIGDTIAAGDLTNFATAPVAWLEWMRWIIGWQAPADPTETELRTWPLLPDAFRVGSYGYIASRVARFLTGTQFVRLVPKDQTLVADPRTEFSFDDPDIGFDEYPWQLDTLPAPVPGVWQIRVDTIPSEIPGDLLAKIEPLRPAGYRFVIGNALSPSLGWDDATTGFDLAAVQLD